MKKTSFIILFILFPFIVFSQPKEYETLGTIADSTNKKGVPFATITLTKLPEKSIEKQIVAKEDGKFNLPIKLIGGYMLTISSIGYKTINKSFSIREDKSVYDFGTISMNIDLVELNSISIIADKPLVKVESDKLIYSVESDIEAKTSDGLEIMEKVPMLVVTDRKIKVNGSGNVKIYINGKPDNIITKNPTDFLQNIPASTIKNIEVITKPGAKYDAEFNGSIINIIMQKKSKGYTCSLNNSVSFGNGLYFTNGINFTTGFGKFGVSINVSNRSLSRNIYDKNTYRENFIDDNQKYINWLGEYKHNWFYLPIFVDFTYEIDTLNLINANFSSSYDKSEDLYEAQVDIQNNLYDLQQAYLYNNSYVDLTKEYVGNINYQNISKKNKSRIITLSYQINYLPIYLKNKYSIDSIFNYQSAKQISEQNEIWTEHTFQIDYTLPINSESELETGVKYILRKDESNSNILDYQFTTNQFVENTELNNVFNYYQNVLAAYLTYSVNINKFSIKLGARGEGSKINGVFSYIETTYIKHTATEFVPSFNLSYKLTKSQHLRFSYSKKIKRPSVWHINPYIDKRDPNNYYSGNPNIKTEHFHNFELNYGNYGKFGNLNFNLSYMKSKDGIARVIIQNNSETILTTFNNIAETQKYNASLSLMLKLGKKTRFRISPSVNYNVLENTNDTTNSQDWGYSLFSNLDYKIIKGLKFSVSGFYILFPEELQTNTSAYYSTKLKLKKEFLQGKLNVTLFYKNPIWKFKGLNYENFNDTFYQKTEEIRLGYSYGFKISYKFGKLKNQINKVKKGIYNNDLKGRG